MNNPIEVAVYEIAKESLGKHIAENPSIAPDVNCANSVSYVFVSAKVENFSSAGFAGTDLLYAWAKENLEQIANPEAGCLVISPTGTSSIGTLHGHTGICGQPGLMGNGRTGVMSNDSDTGLFMEKYSIETWHQLFGEALGFPVYYFRVK